jgi:hypothetical protein
VSLSSFFVLLVVVLCLVCVCVCVCVCERERERERESIFIHFLFYFGTLPLTTIIMLNSSSSFHQQILLVGTQN